MTSHPTTPAPDPLRQALAAAPPGTLAVAAEGALARALLEEASWSAGGTLLPLPGGGWALVGAADAPARRAADAIAALGGKAPRLLPLPGGGAALLAPPPAAPPGPAPARLRLLRDAEGAARGQLLSPGPGPREEACRALLRGLAGDPPPLRPGLRLFLECPEGDAAGTPGAGGGAGPRAPVAVLPLAALARPAALAERRAALARCGWEHGLVGPDPEALGWMDGGEAWALAPPGPAPPPVLPPRLVLLGPRPAWAPPGALHEDAP